MIKLTKEQKLEGMRYCLDKLMSNDFIFAHICFALEDYLFENHFYEFDKIYFRTFWKSFFNAPYDIFDGYSDTNAEPRIKFLKEQIKLLENDN